jgi:4-hydroxy-tetrahydrodipicolinate synthase
VPAIRKLYDDFKAGKPGLAAQQERLTSVRKILQLRPLIPVMKHLIADGLRDPAWRAVRPPLLELPHVEAAALESELSAFGWSLPAG